MSGKARAPIEPLLLDLCIERKRLHGNGWLKRVGRQIFLASSEKKILIDKLRSYVVETAQEKIHTKRQHYDISPAILPIDDAGYSTGNTIVWPRIFHDLTDFSRYHPEYIFTVHIRMGQIKNTSEFLANSRRSVPFEHMHFFLGQYDYYYLAFDEKKYPNWEEKSIEELENIADQALLLNQSLASFKSFYLRLFQQDHHTYAAHLLHIPFDGSDDDFPIYFLNVTVEDDDHSLNGQYYSPEWVKKIFQAIEHCYNSGAMEQAFNQVADQDQQDIQNNLQDMIQFMQHAVNTYSSVLLIAVPH